MSAVITKAMTNITFTTCYNPAVVIRKNSLAGVLDGALGRNRTGTELPPPDFESGASTNFTTRAFKRNYCIKKYFKDYLKCRKKDAKFKAS